MRTFAQFFQPSGLKGSSFSFVSMGKFSAFKIPLKTLPAGISDFSFHLDKSFFVNMECTDIHNADIEVKLTVNALADVFALDFKLDGTVTLLCDRCLDDLVLPIDAKYNISVKYGDRYNDDSDTLLEIPRSDNDLNVAYMIYDTVMLEIPLKHVHPAGQCNKAMSALLRKHSAQGADEFKQDLLDSVEDAPTDPRWDALKGLAGENDE